MKMFPSLTSSSRFLWLLLLVSTLITKSFSLKCKHCSDATTEEKQALQVMCSTQDQIAQTGICDGIAEMKACDEPDEADCSDPKYSQLMMLMKLMSSGGGGDLGGFGLGREDGGGGMSCVKTVKEDKKFYGCFENKPSGCENENGTETCYCNSNMCEPGSENGEDDEGETDEDDESDSGNGTIIFSWFLTLICLVLPSIRSMIFLQQ